MFCHECGEKIFEGDTVVNISGVIYCEDCIEGYSYTYEEPELEHYDY